MDMQEWLAYGRVDPGAVWLLFLSFGACVFQVCFAAALIFYTLAWLSS